MAADAHDDAGPQRWGVWLWCASVRLVPRRGATWAMLAAGLCGGCYSSAHIQPEDLPRLSTERSGPERAVVTERGGRHVEVERHQVKYVQVVRWNGDERVFTRPFRAGVTGDRLWIEDQDAERPGDFVLESVHHVKVSQKDKGRGAIVTGSTIVGGIPGGILGVLLVDEDCQPVSDPGDSSFCGIASGYGFVAGAVVTGGIALLVSLALTGDLPEHEGPKPLGPPDLCQTWSTEPATCR